MTSSELFNADVEFGVSEPADFALENGAGPYRGRITGVEPESLTICLTDPCAYKGVRFTTVKARVRHVGQSFENWDRPKVLLVNFVVDIPSVTHLVGGLRLASQQRRDSGHS